ncbi:1-deoxy-D-xylulose-5-phosphate reductoisomerase [Thermodesulfobacteriota bacterium]
MKRLSILGSTGSIGRNALEVVRLFPDRFSVEALAAGRNVSLLLRQIAEFQPKVGVVIDEERASAVRKELSGSNTRIICGSEGYREAACLPSADIVVSSIVGSAGLLPTLAAIDAGKSVALANKEALVMAGEIVMETAARNRVSIMPVDSEHSAIFQCLQGQPRHHLERILLTASGGPFLDWPQTDFGQITPERALNHPTWDMGPKVTIDSATLMNKGLEVIEARWLFDVSQKSIQVVIHPESIIHSMVAFRDGAVIAQMGMPDMKGAIAYALSYPDRLPLNQPLPDFAELAALTFREPDWKKFPCLSMAFDACSAGLTYPAVLNAANEVAVQAFLDCRIPFDGISHTIAKTLDNHVPAGCPGLGEILDADAWARRKTTEHLRGMRS